LSEVKWIKLVTEFFDDEKIKLIEAMPEADMVLVIWIKLLTLAGKKNMNGYIFLTKNIPYTDEMFSTLFNRPLNTVRLALNTFKNFGMINYEDDNVIKITNWEKHQNIEGMEKIKEQNRLRQKKFREKPALSPPTTPIKEEEIDKIRVDKIRLDKIRGITLHNVITNGGKLIFNYLTKNWENITKDDIKDWSIINPDCDINVTLEVMRQWLIDHKDHPKKRFRKFIVGWIKRDLNKKGGNNGKSKGYNKPDTSGSKGSGFDKYKQLEETYEV